MKRVYLNKDHRAYALIDDEDYIDISQYHWVLKRDGYAYRQEYKGKKVTLSLLMHHQILGKPKDGYVIDHINHNELDNRRCNLRFVTQHDNQLNRRGLQRNNTSGYPGIRQHAYTGKDGQVYWQAEAKRYGKNKYIGYFKSIEEAWNARQNFLAGAK